MQEPRVHSLGREDPLEKEMETLRSTLAGEFYGQRAWRATFAMGFSDIHISVLASY